MRTQIASLVPWIGAATLLFAVACASDAAGDELDDPASLPPGATISDSLPPGTVISDPLPLAPDGDPPADEDPIVEPGPGGTPPSDDPKPLPPPVDGVETPAPIVAAELLIAESYPPQYFVAVTSAQPNGCHRFSRFEVTRNGTEIEIAVWNTVPKNLAVVLCTAIYGQTETSVALGSDFEPGESYTISVNGEQQSFVAQ